MRCCGLAVILAGLATAVGSLEVHAADAGGYVVEAPDILRLDVTGLRKKAQPVKGKFLVRPDGTISLGGYGSVAVSGLTLDQVSDAITRNLAAHATKSKFEVHAQVEAFNSKVYYLITSGKDREQVYRFPATASETVVGAILQVEVLSAVATKGHVRIADSSGKSRDVDWQAITQQGQSATNYRLKAGDRVYVASTPPK